MSIWQKNYNEAAQYLNRALNVQKKLLGEEHPDTYNTYNNLGGAYECTGDFKQAAEYFSKAYDGFRKILGEEHPTTQIILNNLLRTQKIMAPEKKDE